ncbi:MAG: hypothetical protein ACE5OR_02695, partial [bacterium]
HKFHRNDKRMCHPCECRCLLGACHPCECRDLPNLRGVLPLNKGDSGIKTGMTSINVMTAEL